MTIPIIWLTCRYYFVHHKSISTILAGYLVCSSNAIVLHASQEVAHLVLQRSRRRVALEFCFGMYMNR
jgi:hypothetical protein